LNKKLFRLNIILYLAATLVLLVISVSKPNEPNPTPSPTISVQNQQATATVRAYETAQQNQQDTQTAKANTQVALDELRTKYPLTLTARPTLPPYVTATPYPTIIVNAKPCQTSDLNITVKFLGKGGGDSFIGIFLTNINVPYCTLQGYPLLEFVDEAGNLIVRNEAGDFDNQGYTNKIIGLAPGKTAYSRIRHYYRCSSNIYKNQKHILKITLPHNQSFFLHSWADHVCESFDGVEYSRFNYADDDWQNSYP
jgi:Protein of unknown function (DUF4232)